MNYLARVNPRYMAALHLFSGKGDVRYYLNGICIEKHPEQGVVLIATNGHHMAILHDPDGWAAQERIIVPDLSRRLLSACTKNRANFEAPRALWIADNAVVLSCAPDQEQPDPFDSLSLAAERIELIDGKFPDWKRVVPTIPTPVVEMPHLASHLIADFDKACKILIENKRHGNALQLDASGPHTSLLVRIAHHELYDRFLGVIMPMRGDAKRDLQAPGWARHPAKAAE